MSTPTEDPQLQPLLLLNLPLWKKAVLLFLGSAIFLISFITFIGWIIQSPLLVIPFPQLYAMAYSTSILMMSSGLYIIFRTLLFNKTSYFLLVFLLIASTIGSLDILFGTGHLIEDLFIHPEWQLPIPYQSRPAANTMFSLFGLSLSLLSLRNFYLSPLLIWIASLILTLILLFTLTTLYGYLEGVERSTLSFDASRMAFSTALCFLLNCIALLPIAFHYSFYYPRQNGLFHMVMGFIMTIAVYSALYTSWKFEANQNLQLILSSETSSLLDTFSARVEGIGNKYRHFFTLVKNDPELLHSFLKSQRTSEIESGSGLHAIYLLTKGPKSSELLFGSSIEKNTLDAIAKQYHDKTGFFTVREWEHPCLLYQIPVKEDRIVVFYDPTALFQFSDPSNLYEHIYKMELFIDHQPLLSKEYSNSTPTLSVSKTNTTENLTLTLVLTANKNFLRDLGGTMGINLLFTGFCLALLSGWFLYLLQESQLLTEALIRSDNAKTLFLSNVSHEIRTPLHGIIGTASLFDPSKMEKKEKRYLDLILLSSRNLHDIVTNVLDLTKIEAGKVTPHPEWCDGDKVCKEVIDLVKQRATEAHLKLSYTYAQEIPGSIELSIGAFKQILTNLLTNAIKYTIEGSVSLQVQVYQNNDGKEVIRLVVQDTGVGIPEDKKELVFKKFAQVDPQFSMKKGGVGIGLYLTKLLVDGLHGEIWFDSELGKGSTFYVELPTRFQSNQSS